MGVGVKFNLGTASSTLEDQNIAAHPKGCYSEVVGTHVGTAFTAIIVVVVVVADSVAVVVVVVVVVVATTTMERAVLTE